ncbi:hypothetical protein WJX82_007738 [Trebouxia sp. C0006]
MYRFKGCSDSLSAELKGHGGHFCWFEKATEIAENRRKRLLALLAEDPLKDPREEGTFMGPLESWVLEEAVAAYTGTGPSLQAALDIHKRNAFLAVEGWRFRETLNDLRMDVKYHKKWNPKRRKQAQPSQRPVFEPEPHPIGLTESWLRAAAERECIWDLGMKMGRMDPARRPVQSHAEDVAELHANAFQKVLDMPSLPTGFRKSQP